MKLQGCGAITLNYPLANNTSARLISMRRQQASSTRTCRTAGAAALRRDVCFFVPLWIFPRNLEKQNNDGPGREKNLKQTQRGTCSLLGDAVKNPNKGPKVSRISARGPVESTSPLIHINRPKPHNDFIISIYVSVAAKPTQATPPPPNPLHPPPPTPPIH